MNWAILPPEVVSAQLYAGPGAGSLLASAAAWELLATEYAAAGDAWTVIVTAIPWSGPASTAMRTAAQNYARWLDEIAGHTVRAGTAARSAAVAYQTARAAAVPPGAVMANRTTLLQLASANLLGQNSAAIAATEAAYGQMWAQNTAAMTGYAAQAQAATSTLAAPSTASIDLSPSGWIGQLTIALLGSGPYQMPTEVLALLTGLWAASSVAAVPDVLNHVRNSVSVPPLAATPPIRPSIRITARGGTAGRIGVLSVPPAWATQAPETVRITAPTIAAAAAEGAPDAIPLPLANLNSIGRSDVQKRQPRYGDPPTVMPKTPAGG